jgi:hypothetical protein
MHTLTTQCYFPVSTNNRTVHTYRTSLQYREKNSKDLQQMNKPIMYRDVDDVLLVYGHGNCPRQADKVPYCISLVSRYYSTQGVVYHRTQGVVYYCMQYAGCRIS